jgi:hypothetical protein
MVQLSAFVERFYPLIVPIVLIAAALLWAAQRRLLLPYVVSAVFIVVLSGVTGVFRIFFISLPSYAAGIAMHLVLAALLSFPVQVLWRRLR